MKIKRKAPKEFVTTTKKGLEPGSLIYQGDISPSLTQLRVYKIKKTGIEALTDISSKENLPPKSKDYILWIRFSGLENIQLMKEIGETYGIDHITLEDVLDTSHSSKFENFESYVFVIFKKLLYDHGNDLVDTKQVSIVLQNGVLVTFEEIPTEELDIVVTRMSKRADVFFNKGAAYVAYAIMDTIVDDYLGVLDKLQFDIEAVEDLMVSTKGPIDTEDLYIIKRRINSFYRSTRLTDEIVEKLMKSLAFNSGNKISVSYLKDLSDHAVRLRDIINNSRDTINAIYDENLSRMQLQTSYFINVLTIVNVLLWPFMIISGIFGMNFETLPFTSFKHGFYVSVGAMVSISLLLLFYFKKKKFF